MESPTMGSGYVARISKKRVFPGGSSSSGCKEVEILETAPLNKITCQPMSSKKKKVVCEIIDVDLEDDVTLIDGKVDIKGKGKCKGMETSSNFSSGVTNDGPGTDIKTLKQNFDIDDPKSNIFFGEDEWINTYYEDITFDDHTPVVDSKLDHMDLPPGVEVSFPWLSGGHEGSTNSTSTSSSLKIGSKSKKEKLGKNKRKKSSYDLNGGPPDKVEQNVDEISQKFELFKKFDMVEYCSDHYFLNKGSSKQVNPPKNWATRIQEEWKILEKDLPDAIFVRVYESRMDLLRAVIVGAEGTPYHDGLFFFDVLFPEKYPNSPPKVHYHSGGLRINPNLYNCGKVCLSLLNTWFGSKKESWSPKESTMLQVLVSIQGLILNAKPYFNEPGYAGSGGTISGEESSLRYNETTFIDSLRTMVYTMKRPPKHFEALVKAHFCMHARDILVSCKAYLEGAQVGCLVRGGVQDVDEGDKSCSKNFKSSLAGYIATLINALSQIGAKDCDEFLSLAQKARRLVVAPPRAVKKGKMKNAKFSLDL